MARAGALLLILGLMLAALLAPPAYSSGAEPARIALLNETTVQVYLDIPGFAPPGVRLSLNGSIGGNSTAVNIHVELPASLLALTGLRLHGEASLHANLSWEPGKLRASGVLRATGGDGSLNLTLHSLALEAAHHGLRVSLSLRGTAPGNYTAALDRLASALENLTREGQAEEALITTEPGVLVAEVRNLTLQGGNYGALSASLAGALPGEARLSLWAGKSMLVVDVNATVAWRPGAEAAVPLNLTPPPGPQPGRAPILINASALRELGEIAVVGAPGTVFWASIENSRLRALLPVLVAKPGHSPLEAAYVLLAEGLGLPGNTSVRVEGPGGSLVVQLSRLPQVNPAQLQAPGPGGESPVGSGKGGAPSPGAASATGAGVESPTGESASTPQEREGGGMLLAASLIVLAAVLGLLAAARRGGG